MYVNCNTTRIVSTGNPEITSKYFKEARRLDTLTSEEQLEILRRYKKCENKKEKEELRNKLLLANQSFIISMARHISTDDDFNDLINEGNLGMVKAIELFDVTKENNFLTYASFYVRKYMIDYQCNTKKIIKPKNVARVYAYSESEKSNFFCKNGRFPTEDELIENLEEKGIIFSNKEDLYDISVSSIDSFSNSDYGGDADNERNTWFDNVWYLKSGNTDNVDTAKCIDRMTTSKIVEQSLSYLSDSEKDLVCKYYGIGCEQQSPCEIAYRLGLGYDESKVEKMLNKYIKKIRKHGKVQINVH